MNCKFLIIQDNIQSINFVKSSIIKAHLGTIVEILNDSEHAFDEILFYNPDIVIIDHNIKHEKTIEMIKSLNVQKPEIIFVLFTYEHNEEIISNYFESGVRFYIRNPLSQTEIIYRLKEICHTKELEKKILTIKGLLCNENKNFSDSSKDEPSQIKNILSDLGIIGEVGTRDLIRTIELVLEYKKRMPNKSYQLQDIYVKIAEENTFRLGKEISSKSIEQRIRRSILKALNSISQLGIDDYYNVKFIDYSSRLFDLKQVKQEISHIKNSSSPKGKINIKKFLEGIIHLLNF